MPLTLVTGPVRSGKSRYALTLAKPCPRVTYIATALRDANDVEWEARLQRHVAERPEHWRTFESYAHPATALHALLRDAHAEECFVFDALGTWIAARIGAQIEVFERDYAAFEEALDAEAAQLATAMLGSRAHVIVVAEEVGWDVVPVAASARLFRDVMGRVKAALAHDCERAFLVVCGYAIDLRSVGSVIP